MVAAAFAGRPGFEVVVLYPKGMVSERQERQLTCWGGNVSALRVRGDFDACQRLVKEAASLFEADRTRQPYSPSHNRLVVSPETSRELLTAFIRGARKQLLIYDEKVSDKLIQRVLQDRVRRGVEIRVIGKLEKPIEGILTRKVPDLRLHVRAMVRDAASAFLGSQSLRKLELDGRREVGVIVNDSRIAKKMQAVFEADWAQAGGGKWAEKAEKRKGGKTADKNDKGVTEAVSA